MSATSVDLPGVRRIGEYQLVGPHVGQSMAPEVLILDTNVVIDIRDYYFGGERPDRLGVLLREFPNVGTRSTDIHYGWGVAEATQRRGKVVDVLARRKLVHAAETIVGWDLKQIETNLGNRHPPVNRDRRWGRKPIDSAESIGDPRLLVLPQYGALLYLMKLYSERKSWSGRDSLWPLEQYVRWTNETFGIRSSYCLSLAVSLLVGNADGKRDATRIFKLSGNESPDQLARKSWNVAWDISMISLVEGMTYGLLPGQEPRAANLVTRDADPVLLRIASEVRVMVENRENRVPMNLVEFQTHKRLDSSRLDTLLQFDPLESFGRLNRDPQTVIKKAARAVRDLEEELGLTEFFSFDGWPTDFIG